jgi:hypothetical protein
MKLAVKDELTIPPQTRFVFPIYLGRVERHASSLPIYLVARLMYAFSGLRRKPGERPVAP